MFPSSRILATGELDSPTRALVDIVLENFRIAKVGLGSEFAEIEYLRRKSARGLLRRRNLAGNDFMRYARFVGGMPTGPCSAVRPFESVYLPGECRVRQRSITANIVWIT